MEQLSFEELKKLISSGESKSVEFKRISMFRDSSEILEQLSAFSNREWRSFTIWSSRRRFS